MRHLGSIDLNDLTTAPPVVSAGSAPASSPNTPAAAQVAVGDGGEPWIDDVTLGLLLVAAVTA